MRGGRTECPPVASPPHPPFPAARSRSGLSLAASPPKTSESDHVPALPQADGGVGSSSGGGAPPPRRGVWRRPRPPGAPPPPRRPPPRPPPPPPLRSPLPPPVPPPHRA